MNDSTPSAARMLLDQMATPEHQAASYLANAIHLQRCGPEPDHGPYAHEDEAKWYAGVLSEGGLLASEVPAQSGAAARIASYLSAHDELHADPEGAGGPSTRTEVARLVTTSGTYRLTIADLRAAVSR